MEECVNDRNDDSNEKKYEGKMAEWLDDTPPSVIEESVSDRNYDKNEKFDEDKEAEFPDDTSPI